VIGCLTMPLLIPVVFIMQTIAALLGGVGNALTRAASAVTKPEPEPAPEWQTYHIEPGDQLYIHVDLPPGGRVWVADSKTRTWTQFKSNKLAIKNKGGTE
jgi:hypothetical protein